jgi:hypothetical protein
MTYWRNHVGTNTTERPTTIIQHISTSSENNNEDDDDNMINLTGIVPEDFFSGDWMVTSLPSLTLEQKNLISGILEKLLTESSNFNKEQVDVIKEYWGSVTDDDDDEEVILCAAYRAG